MSARGLWVNSVGTLITGENTVHFDKVISVSTSNTFITMTSPLNKSISDQEVQELIRHFIFNVDNDIDVIIEKLSRQRSYEIRKHSHSVSARNTTVRKIDFERTVWNHYIRQQLELGKTTGELSKELDKPLEFLNSFF